MYITSRRRNSYSASRHFPGSNNFLLNIPQIIRYSHLICPSNHVCIIKSRYDNIAREYYWIWETNFCMLRYTLLFEMSSSHAFFLNPLKRVCLPRHKSVLYIDWNVIRLGFLLPYWWAKCPVTWWLWVLVLCLVLI